MTSQSDTSSTQVQVNTKFDHHRIIMAKVFLLLTFLVASIAAQSNNDTNVDHVLKPLPGKAGAPKMFVFIPGANGVVLSPTARG